MRSWLTLALVLLLSTHAVAYDLPQLAAQTKPSVVLLTIVDGSGDVLATGTGFFVSEDGRIVTNHHVIENGARATATLADGKEIDILGVLAWDAARDVAILQAESGPKYPALPLGDVAAVRPGDEVIVIGSPLGLSATVSAGIVSAVREKGASLPPHRSVPEGDVAPVTRSWGIQITAPISPGSSGSPIMTPDGKVIAVAVGTFVEGQSLNFGIPIQFAKDLLSGLDPTSTPQPLQAAQDEGGGALEILRNLGISAGVFVGLFVLYFVVTRLAARRKARPKARSRNK